ncbi:hypothetical protein [Bernardetia sp.]|uniref:hypothetical protein n=1 Tax=Bernardetia sp. TaxID=1937974 RepID=UPI0025BAFB19|nr:hypothetical protein [Bernardetia sp.]
MKKIVVVLSLLLVVFSAFTLKEYSKKEIDEITNAIDYNSSLRPQILDANDVYETAFDGGGKINLHWKQDNIKKIYREIGTSYGRLSTIFYFDDNKIIKIIEIEEDFEFDQDMNIEYEKGVSEVFKEEIYVFDYENKSIQILKTGKRKVSNQRSISEYYQVANFILEKAKN